MTHEGTHNQQNSGNDEFFIHIDSHKQYKSPKETENMFVFIVSFIPCAFLVTCYAVM